MYQLLKKVTRKEPSLVEKIRAQYEWQKNGGKKMNTNVQLMLTVYLRTSMLVADGIAVVRLSVINLGLRVILVASYISHAAAKSSAMLYPIQ